MLIPIRKVIYKCGWLFTVNECTVSRQRDVSTRLSQPKLTPTSSRRSSQSSVSGAEESSSITNSMQPASLNSKLSRQLSNLSWHSRSLDSCASLRDQLTSAAGESGRRQVSVIKISQNNRVQKAANNVTDTAKSQQTGQSNNIQRLQHDQKTRPMSSGGSKMTITRPNHIASKQLQLAVSALSTSSSGEVTIACHKPTASSNNTDVPTQQDTTGTGSAKGSNTRRTSRLAAKPPLAATHVTRNTNCTGSN